MEFDRRLGNIALETPVKYQNDWTALNLYPVALRFREIWGQDVMSPSK